MKKLRDEVRWRAERCSLVGGAVGGAGVGGDAKGRFGCEQ